MTALARVTAVEHIGARVWRITFSDGRVRELDFADALPGVLATIDDDEVFAGAAVDSIAGVISCSNGIDLDPDVLHGDDASASVVQPLVVSEDRGPPREPSGGCGEPALPSAGGVVEPGRDLMPSAPVKRPPAGMSFSMNAR